MFFKYWWLLFTLLLPISSSAQWWNPLAPKNFEDCVLKNMKGVSSDAAANMVYAMCFEKFPQKVETPTTGVVRCDLYWNGSRFVKGPMPKDFIIFRRGYMGVEVLALGVPRSMLPSLGLPVSLKGEPNETKQFLELFDKQWWSIKILCDL